EALAELNRIVARHGRGLDTAEPGRRGPPPPPLPPREEPMTVGGPGPVRGDARGDYGRPEAAPPARPTMRPDRSGPGPAGPGAPRADGPALSPPQGGGPPGGARGGNGWLSDLLTRASREGAEPGRPNEAPRRHGIESLDSISVDIARMIDPDAAAELWERYKRGERNVFTRRLYTLQGQKAFDEIRKRYRSDRDFKATVDRYIGGFERL